MKKFFSAMILAVAIIFVSSSVQAENNFDLNKNFKTQLQPVSYIYEGRVVGISTYLSVRERPSVNSREIMRIPNGSRLVLRFFGDQDWWEVLTINGNYYGVNPGDGIGYVSARYVSTR